MFVGELCNSRPELCIDTGNECFCAATAESCGP